MKIKDSAKLFYFIYFILLLYLLMFILFIVYLKRNTVSCSKCIRRYCLELYVIYLVNYSVLRQNTIVRALTKENVL